MKKSHKITAIVLGALTIICAVYVGNLEAEMNAIFALLPIVWCIFFVILSAEKSKKKK